MVPGLRVTSDNLSQADGSVLHPPWKTGLTAAMRVDYYEKRGQPACGALRRVMHEDLVRLLNAVRDAGEPQRLKWQPTGYGDRRMLDEVQLIAWPDPGYDLNGAEASVLFTLGSPFPYAIDETQDVTDVGGSAGGTVGIANFGNAPFSPVVKVHGPTTGFTVTNLDDVDELGAPLQLVYDSTRPAPPGVDLSIASGHYAEFDFFRGSVYRDGDGDDLIAGVDVEATDLWHLNPEDSIGGPNRIQIVGASATVLSNNAWA